MSRTESTLAVCVVAHESGLRWGQTLYNMYDDAIRMASAEGIHQHQEALHRLHNGFEGVRDPKFALIRDRIDDETGEQRRRAIGAVSIDEEAALLVAAHVYRGQNEEEIVRIISARAASKRERRLYIQ